MESGVNFTIRYDAVDGLKNNAPLMHGDQIIGKVNEVIYTEQGNFDVNVTVDESHHSLATDSALFVITDDPKAKGTQIIKLITSDNPGTLIQDDQVIQGSTKLTGIAREVQNQIGESLQSLASSIDQSISTWIDETAEPTVEQLESELDQLLEEAKALGADAKERIESDVVETIKQHIQRLKQQMDGSNQDDTIDQLEKKVDELEHLMQA
jgi:ribosomal protein S13